MHDDHCRPSSAAPRDGWCRRSELGLDEVACAKFSMFANDTFDELAAVAGGRRPKAIAGEFSECIILGTPFHTTPSYSHQFPINTPLFSIAALVNGSISP